MHPILLAFPVDPIELSALYFPFRAWTQGAFMGIVAELV
jgi:hypothetical protein